MAAAGEAQASSEEEAEQGSVEIFAWFGGTLCTTAGETAATIE